MALDKPVSTGQVGGAILVVYNIRTINNYSRDIELVWLNVSLVEGTEDAEVFPHEAPEIESKNPAYMSCDSGYQSQGASLRRVPRQHADDTVDELANGSADVANTAGRRRRLCACLDILMSE